MIRTTIRARFSAPVECEGSTGSYARVILASGRAGDPAGFVAAFYPRTDGTTGPGSWHVFSRGPRADTMWDLPPRDVLRRLGLATAVCPDCSAPLARDCAGCPACPHGPDDRQCEDCAPDEWPTDRESYGPDYEAPWFRESLKDAGRGHLLR